LFPSPKKQQYLAPGKDKTLANVERLKTLTIRGCAYNKRKTTVLAMKQQNRYSHRHVKDEDKAEEGVTSERGE
jgi:hypothetical protein